MRKATRTKVGNGPLGDLGPFVVLLAVRHVQAGGALTPAVVADLIRQAADEYRERWARYQGQIAAILAPTVYAAIRAQGVRS
jgi:hypothetical protein